MTQSADTRAAVARVLDFRRLRWTIYLGALALEAAAVVTFVRTPVAPFLLLLLAIASLLPVVLLGRYRLPDEEFDDHPHFEDQIRNVRRCFGDHLHFRHHHSNGFGKGAPIEIETRPSNRGISGKGEALAIRAPRFFLLVTPNFYWIQATGPVLSGDIRSIEIDLFDVTQRVNRLRSDDEVICSTWQHATKRGERDLRFRDNRQLWEVRRYVVEIAFGEYRWAVMLYSYDNACMFANAFTAIKEQGPGLTYLDEEENEEGGEDDYELEEDDQEESHDQDEYETAPPRPWHEVLGVAPDAPAAEIKAAFRRRQMEYHPDRVAHLGAKLRVLADEEATAINQAYSDAMRNRR